MRKRNFRKNTYTVLRKQGDDRVVMRGVGLVQPSVAVQAVQEGETTVTIVHEISVTTTDVYPAIDRTVSSNNEYGRFYFPDEVVWTGIPYQVYGQNLWAQQGKDEYRELTCVYDSVLPQTIVDPDWTEITDFETAVDSVEIVNELKLSKVIS